MGASGRKQWRAPKGVAADELRDEDEMDGGDDDGDGEAGLSK